MSTESVALLSAFWSWVSAIASVALLGVLVPASIGLLLGFLPLAVGRRDWRSMPGVLLAIGLFAGCGIVALAAVHRPAPRFDFWLALNLEVGTVVFVVSVVQFFGIARRRLRRDREALTAVSESAPFQVVTEAAAREPGPRSRLGGIEAEYYIAEWMRFLGATEAVVTRARRDGGVDVRSDQYVAQVKHRPQDFVSVDVVRALIGVASLEGRTPILFTSGRYSRDAVEVARRAGAALFIFRASEGRLVGANAAAHRLRLNGMRGREERGAIPQPSVHA